MDYIWINIDTPINDSYVIKPREHSLPGFLVSFLVYDRVFFKCGGDVMIHKSWFEFRMWELLFRANPESYLRAISPIILTEALSVYPKEIQNLFKSEVKEND